jgi:TPP-dependent indolepyruvate ferredoxin oxidoreductase alpha subunit
LKSEVMVGNKAVAYAVKLARANLIAAYPITPQTTIVEYLSEFVASGELPAEFVCYIRRGTPLHVSRSTPHGALLGTRRHGRRKQKCQDHAARPH